MSSGWLSVAEIFGEDVFNDAVMQERLPKKVYKKLKQTIEEGKDLHHLIDEAFDGIADVLQSDIVTNSMLGKLIDRIVVDEHQTVDIYLKIFTDLGLNENLLT